MSETGPPHDPRGEYEPLLELFCDLVNSIRDHNISKFLRYFILSNVNTHHKFFTAPGARGENPGHHSFKGGLAYHTLHAAKLAASIADHYNGLGIQVNKDIVIAGTILHDIGKIDCYEWQSEPHDGENPEEFEPHYVHTKVSKMFHHIPHGFQMFMSAANEFNRMNAMYPDQFKHSLTEKKIQKLGHIILSHHGRKSWSSPVIPNFMEAYIVHAVEMMDSYVDKFNKGYDVRNIYDH